MIEKVWNEVLWPACEANEQIDGHRAELARALDRLLAALIRQAEYEREVGAGRQPDDGDLAEVVRACLGDALEALRGLADHPEVADLATWVVWSLRASVDELHELGSAIDDLGGRPWRR